MIRGSSRSLRIGVLTTALLLSPMAFAVEAGFYMGGDYGNASTSLKIAPFDEIAQSIYANGNFIVTDSSAKLGTDDTTFGFFGGYRFSRHWAIEGAYVDLGKYEYKEQSTGNFADDDPGTAPETFHQTIDVQSRGLAVSGLAILPVNYRFEVYGRVGFTFTEDKLSAKVDSVGLGELRESNWTYLAGAGASLTFADIYSVRVEYTRVFDAGDSKWGKADVDLLTIGLAVTF